MLLAGHFGRSFCTIHCEQDSDSRDDQGASLGFLLIIGAVFLPSILFKGLKLSLEFASSRNSSTLASEISSQSSQIGQETIATASYWVGQLDSCQISSEPFFSLQPGRECSTLSRAPYSGPRSRSFSKSPSVWACPLGKESCTECC